MRRATPAGSEDVKPASSAGARFRGGAAGLLLGVCALAATAGPASRAFADDDAATVAASIEKIDRLRRTADVRGAVDAARDLAKRNPSSLAAQSALGDVLVALGREREALDEFRARARRKEATADDRYLYGRLLRSQQAIDELRAAVAMKPDHFPALCALALELIRTRAFEHADAAIVKARELRPADAGAVNLAGFLEESRGAADKAEALYRQALASQPALRAAKVNLGVLLASRGQHDEALRVLGEAAKSEPPDPTAIVALGMAQIGAGKEDDGLATLARALEADPRSVPALDAVSAAYVDLDRLDLAGQALQKALDAAPESAAAWRAMARLRIAEEDKEKAEIAVKNALRLDDDSAEAHYLQAICLVRDNSPKGADTELRKAIRLDERNPVYHRELGSILAQQGRWREAVKVYLHAADLDASSPGLWREMALAQLGAGDAEPAVDSLRKSLALDDRHADTWMKLGVVLHEKTRDLDGALAAYRKYVALGGKDTRVPRWIEELEAATKKK